MGKCKKCGTVLEETEKFCGYCGTKQESIKKEVVIDKKKEEELNIYNKSNVDKVVDISKEDMVSNAIDKKESLEDKNEDKVIAQSSIKISKNPKSAVDVKESNPNMEKKQNAQDKKEIGYKQSVKPAINKEMNSKRQPNASAKNKEKMYNAKPKKNKRFTFIILVLFVLGFIGSYALLASISEKNMIEREDNSSSVNYNNLQKEKPSESVNKQINEENNKSNKKTDGYILPNSNKKPLTAKDLQNMSKEQLAFARNEIFARHGYKFGEPFKSYFESKSWYKVNPNYTNDKNELSPLERHNAKVILMAEGNGENLSDDYDADYYEKGNEQSDNKKHNSSNSKNVQQIVSQYVKSMPEAISKNDYSIVRPYIIPNSELSESQKGLISNLNSQNITEELEKFRITNVESISKDEYKVSTYEKYIIHSNGEKKYKEFNSVYTVSIFADCWGLSKIEN